MTIQLRTTGCNYLKRFLISSLFLLVFNFQGNLSLYSQNNDNLGNHREISFEDRLEFYLNQKIKRFFSDMAVKEKTLLQLIKNVTVELKNRGKEALLNDEIGYEEIWGESEQLITEYSQELNQILAIIKEIDQLERVVDQNIDLTAWERVANLRERIIALLENRQLYKEGIHTQGRVNEMVHDYNSELDSVLSFYGHLDNLNRSIKAQASDQIQELIGSQRDSISVLLENLTSTVSDTLVDQYIIETELMNKLLKEVKALELRALNHDTEISLEIDDFRKSVLQRIDNRLFDLMEHDTDLGVKGPRLSEIFKEWKAAQIANYDVQYTQYKIMKKNLLLNGSAAERSRMLASDLKDALMNYVEGNYDLAEVQFSMIWDDYSAFFDNLEPVLFYRAECLYGRQLFDEAAEQYKIIVNEYPDSPYLGESLFRLMLINEKFDNKADFYKYFEILKSPTAQVEKSLYNQSNYLAGYVYLKDSKFDEAKEVLSNVAKDSKYYLMARYLLGIVLVNQQDFANAIEIFEDLIDEESYPWTAPQTTFIQNNSLLKLAYIRYELGEYQLALNYFSKVSPGFSGYDKSLLGAAWANFKLGNYPQTIENVNQLLQDYLASNYTYEALILSAHSKNLLKQQDSALQDYRYVATAQRVLELSDFYNNERKLILDQLTEVEQIEEEILERGDKDLYEVTSQIRDHLHKMLLQFQHRSGTGDSVFEGFVTERDSILQQIEYLDNIIAQASETSETDVANAAYQQRERLMKVLEVFQADSSIHNTNYFIEYPLATKEGTVKYRMAILSDLVQQIDNERRRIRDNLERAERLQGKNAYYTANLNAKFDLEILENELKHLKHRSSQLQAWLVDNQVQDLNTNFDKWADLSGFGISEITFQNIKERDERISDLSTNINSINQILQERRKSLEQKLVELDEQIEQIEEKLRKEKIENEKKKTESYFNESYFDFKGTEDEGVETLIPPNNSNEPN